MIEKLKNINLNTILIIVGIVFMLLYLQQCNRSSNLNEEVKIANMNQAAMLDSVTTYKDKSGTLVHEKSILIASEKELKDLNKDLYEDLKDLKDHPKIVFKETIVVVHDTTTLITTVNNYGDDSYGLVWTHDTTYTEGNFQRISGETFFDLSNDGIENPTTLINKNEFGMSFITGLTEGKDGYEIFIKSDYPNFVATNIEGAIIDKKMIQSNESAWVIGPNVGYGIVFSGGSIQYGVTVGVGVTYNMNKKVKKLFRPYSL